MSEGRRTPIGLATSPHSPIWMADEGGPDEEGHSTPHDEAGSGNEGDCTADERSPATVLDDSGAGSTDADPSVASPTAAATTSLPLPPTVVAGVEVADRVPVAPAVAVAPVTAPAPGASTGGALAGAAGSSVASTAPAPSRGQEPSPASPVVVAASEKENEGTAVLGVPEKASAAVPVTEKVGPCLCPKHTEGAHETVNVESRCWPGINKPGGVATIVKKHVERKELFGEDVELVYYDVKYVLGGTEKRVKETYISCTPSVIVARQPRPRDRFTVPVSEARRSGRGTPSGKKSPRPATPPVTSGKRKSPASAASSSSSRASALSPLGASTVGSPASCNAERGGSKGEAKAKGKGKASTAKRSKQAAEEAVATSKKRSLSHASELSSGKTHKKSAHKSKSASKKVQGQGSLPPMLDVPVSRHKKDKTPSSWRAASLEKGASVAPMLVDLTPATEPTVSTSAPLSERRMLALTTALRRMFDKSADRKLVMQGIQAEVNKAIVSPTEAFEDKELELGLKHLDDVEGKIMICNGNMYLV